MRKIFEPVNRKCDSASFLVGQSLLRLVSRSLSEALQDYPSVIRPLKSLFLALPPFIRGRQLVHDELKRLALSRSNVFFVQVGANDGAQNDPLSGFIRRYGWKGILVEPVPLYFEALRANYRGIDGLTFENIAISDSLNSREFWYLEDVGGILPDWAKGVGSFFRNQVMAETIPGIEVENYLRSIQVPCRTLPNLLTNHGSPDVNLLVIDTQGFDAEIILQLDFTKWLPNLIVFEHCLLTPACKQRAFDHLESAGYHLESDSIDVVARQNADA